MQQANARSYFAEAAKLTRAAQHDEAARLLLRAIEAEPRQFESYARLINISRRVSDKAAVIAALRQVAQEHPGCVPAFRCLAHYCALMGDIAGSIGALKAGVRAKHAKHAAELLADDDSDAAATPDFLIIGAEKSGTSSLYDDMCRHPRVLGALDKEPYFFTEFYAFGWDWYRAHFPRIKAGAQCLTGEASTTYLTDEQAPARVAADLPKARLIVIMRDPVARAVSQYNQLAKLGRINKSIDEAFSDELEILQAAAGDPDRAGQLCFDSGKACLWRSLYVVFLDRWLQRYPAEQLLTLRSEDYFGDAEATMRRVWGFLGMQASSTPASAMSNQGEKTASPSAELTMRLRAFFQPYNRRLSERVGWDCRWD